MPSTTWHRLERYTKELPVTCDGGSCGVIRPVLCIAFKTTVISNSSMQMFRWPLVKILLEFCYSKASENLSNKNWKTLSCYNYPLRAMILPKGALYGPNYAGCPNLCCRLFSFSVILKIWRMKIRKGLSYNGNVSSELTDRIKCWPGLPSYLQASVVLKRGWRRRCHSLYQNLNESKLKTFSFQTTWTQKPKKWLYSNTCINLPELPVVLDSDSELFSLILTDFLPLFRAADRQTKTGWSLNKEIEKIHSTDARIAIKIKIFFLSI